MAISPMTGWLRRLLLTGWLALAGCSPQPAAPLRIGIAMWPGYDLLFLAAEHNHFARAGVEVKLVEFSSLSETRSAYGDGLLDGMASSLVEVVQLDAFSDHAPTVVMALDYSNGADLILAKFSELSQLRGNRVGVEPASLGGYILKRALDHAGLTIDDLTVIQGEQLTLEAMFGKGELDAVVTYPPFAAHIQRRGGVHILFSSADLPHEVVDLLSFDRQIIASRRADVKKVILVWEQMVERLHHHPEQYIYAMAGREKISPQEFKWHLDRITLLKLADQSRLLAPQGAVATTAQRVHTVMSQINLAGKLANPAPGIQIDPTLVQEVVRERNR